MGSYRDDIDALKIKVEKTAKLESDVIKYKEKLLELEGIKKRAQVSRYLMFFKSLYLLKEDKFPSNLIDLKF